MSDALIAAVTQVKATGKRMSQAQVLAKLKETEEWSTITLSQVNRAITAAGKRPTKRQAVASASTSLPNAWALHCNWDEQAPPGTIVDPMKVGVVERRLRNWGFEHGSVLITCAEDAIQWPTGRLRRNSV